jgi:predicted RNA-binding protein (virulence factor B family)
MQLHDMLGRTGTLRIERFAAPGAFLVLPDDDDGEGPEILLPRGEVPDAAREGDTIDVFVYLDSSDRPVASARAPLVQLHEVAFLRVTDVNPRLGAFVDWGLSKELLVPFAEQTEELAPGGLAPFGVIVDRTGRLAGTMRVRELLEVGGDFELDEWVEGEAFRKEPGIGVFVILERKYIGLLPEHEPNNLSYGQASSFRVVNVHADGKVELSLRGRVHEEIDADARRILAVLRAPSPPRVGDSSSPEQIRALFGLSKKAFKRAAGRLLKEGAVVIDERGHLQALHSE